MTIKDAQPTVSPTAKIPIRRIAFVGNYLPAKCGIATFTADLTESLAVRYPDITFLVLPTSDPNVGRYPERVRFVIEKDDVASYKQAAYFLNMNHIDLVCLQHEYGIFGGPSGRHILALLKELHMPIITTFHTILDKPIKEQEKIFREIVRTSDRLVVMTRRDLGIVKDRHKLSREKINLIPHGIPDVPFIDPNFYKDQIGVEGKYVLLTFGLLSANKGIENVIKALPAIIEKHPQVVYIVLGATHPNVLRAEGDTYRESLVALADKLQVTEHVLFHDRFVSLDKLIEYISTADIYITPYNHKEQSVSGTLAYAVGLGKAVISTPYWHAEELLAEGRGILVPFKDPGAIAKQVLFLLDNEVKRHTLRKRAYLKTRVMTWDESARKYMGSFSHSLESRRIHPRPARNVGDLTLVTGEMPTLKMRHLQRLTDDTGLLQHAIHAIPHYAHGYSIDDNARGLITAIYLEDIDDYKPLSYELASRYLAFISYALNPKTNRFRNILSFERKWQDEGNSEDAHGRALWSLGLVVGRSRIRSLRDMAEELFQRGLPVAQRFKSPRACAFILLSVHEYLKRFSGDQRAIAVRKKLVNHLVDAHKKYSTTDWPWFEDYLTYCNAKLPHALLVCSPSLGDDRITQLGLDTLDWLISVQTSDEGYFIPIGSEGFYRRGETRARFDQQPIEAYTTLAACIEAYHITGENKWYKESQKIFNWFLGLNDLRLSLYNPRTGGCHDGLHPDRINMNQGAESTLAFLMSWLEINAVQEIAAPVGDILDAEPMPSGAIANST